MAGEIQLNSTTMATESSGSITLSNVDSATNRTNLGLGSIATQAADSVSITGGTIGSGVQFPGKIIKNIYIDSTGTNTTITNSTSNKIVYSVSIPNPQTSYSYLIIGGIGGYVDSGSTNSSLYGSLIKDNGLGTQAYIKDTISIHYLNNVSYDDFGFFLNLNYYYEPATNTAFTIDAAVRSAGFLYSAPWGFNNPFIVLELGGN